MEFRTNLIERGGSNLRNTTLFGDARMNVLNHGLHGGAGLSKFDVDGVLVSIEASVSFVLKSHHTTESELQTLNQNS